MDQHEAVVSAAQAAEALGPEADLVAGLDPVSFGRALAEIGLGLARHPAKATLAGTRYATRLATAGTVAWARAFGARTEPPLPPPARDRRFADPAWTDNPWFFGVLQGYLASARLAQELVGAAEMDERWRDKADLAVQLLVDALAPTNFLATNPAALKRAFDTGGRSLVRGLGHFLDDLATNQGRPRQVDTSPFELGVNLAATKGKVVFRNRLMELIQYAPTTRTTYETPLLASPPWINKYYVMDLAPGRSFVQWAVDHGHTVFAISYRNPDASMRDVKLDDYLLEGPRFALDVIGDITGAPQVNIVGLCLGGTLTTMLLAYLEATGDQRVRSATLLNTLVDFSEPGVLGAFTDQASVERLERKMARRGYLEGREMATTFDLLRANDLLWNYVVSNWLLGDDPPAFDILAWNADSTRMPAAMHSFYLRTCYMENQLARNQMELAGVRLDLDAITADLYLVGAQTDHITPWTSSYKTTQLVKGNTRFVLSSSGHIAGIVNPPSPKARYWTGDPTPPDPDAWLASAREQQGSWWQDWADWAKRQGGQRKKPPPMGSDAHPSMADAPGAYVRER
ncbi:MAG TPA: alpha/beta fold hydrolase [Actinomycetes bacterium]|jgi:polyhydroxyalkanoate synthase|nr:alpha/beta fold hydrolase [Actinomycetes bacterium]